MELPWWRVFVVLLFASTAYLISLFAPDNLILAILFNIVIVIAFITSLILLPVLRKNDRDVLIQLIINPLSIKKVLSKT
jgi:membrane protein YdbS with pleckstrin-like domain